MQFRVLGLVEVVADGGTVTLPRRRERCLLALLLLNLNQLIPADRLVRLLWDDHPPDGARRILSSHVSRARSLLAAVGAADHGVEIVAVGEGYQMAGSPHLVDAHRFQSLVDHATTLDDPAECVRDLRTALDLWRGPPMADAASAWLRRHLCRDLEERRLTAIEYLASGSLTLNRVHQVLPELAKTVDAQPGHERLVALYMRALHQADRKADALAAFAQTRAYLADELGLDPGPALQGLHQAILRDQVPARPDLAPPPPVPQPPPIPRELPADVTAFSGRADALNALDEHGSGAADPTGPVVILAVAGTAGVGKSALVVHWAHRNAGRFPDGQLYVNLRGYDPDLPMTAADALARLLTALGVAGQEVPVDRDDRASRYRSEVAGRRMLIVLDNAATGEQVRPLLPGSGSCTVVVTSRDSLAGLVALHGAHRLNLDLLPLGDATTLLRRLIGSRVDVEPDAAATLAGQCARLPLALRVAAEVAVSRPGFPLAELVVELRDQQRRLELLDGGEPHAAVKVVFSWSIQHLPPDAAHAFRLLGLHPGPDTDAYATAALAGTSFERARQTLDLLNRAHLVHLTSPGRYGMHDLLRSYATHLATDEHTSAQRRAALDRLFDYYLAAAGVAMDSWYPAETHRRPLSPAVATPIPDLADSGTAYGWLGAERSCLVAIAGYTAAHGRPTHATQLSSVLYRYLNGGHYADAMAIHGHAHRAAEQAGDLAGQAYALRSLGAIHGRMGRYASAADHHQQALALLRQVGDRTGQAIALDNLGAAARRLGHYEAAADHHQQALALFQQVGDQTGQANALNNLGIVEKRMGRHEAAADHHQQALALFQQVGDQTSQASALNSLGNVEERMGRHEAAAVHYRQALVRFRQLRDIHGEATVLDSLGTVHIRLGEPEQAIEHLTRALTLFCEIGESAGEAWTLNGLGEAAHIVGHHTDAVTHHTAALALATTAGTRDQQARAQTGLGHAHLSVGDHARARAHYAHALALYASLGMPEAEQVRTHLATLA